MSRRERLVDVGVVVLVLAMALGNTRFDSPRQSSLAYVLDVAMALPLLARRSRPLEVFLTVSAFAFLEWATDTQAGGNFALLAALYAVGAYVRSRRAVALAAVVAQVGVVLAVLRWAPPGQTLTALLLLTGTVTAAWVSGVYLRTRRAYLASVLERARTAERDRDQQALLAAAQERTRIARELHDIVAHSIAVMVALSDGAAATAVRDPAAAREASEQASAAGRQALTEMHRLLGVLRSRSEVDLAPQPGVAEMGDLLAPLRAAGLQVQLVEAGSPAALPASAQLTVYRLVQESLTNVLKHGRSVTRVTVTLRYGEAAVDVTVDDDGAAAASPARAGDGAGHGLVGMRERLAAFGGELRTGVRDGGGWRMSARLPLRPPEHAPAGTKVGVS